MGQGRCGTITTISKSTGYLWNAYRTSGATAVYITEMNHIHARPASTIKLDQPERRLGAGPTKIDRWNKMPYAQKPLGLSTLVCDQCALNDKPGILEDFKMALSSDYRWRTAEIGAFDFAPSAGKTPSAQQIERVEERTLVRPDDLTRIWGIGDKTQKVLNAAGILIYEQLARLTPEQLKIIVSESGLRTRYLATWPEQAAALVKGNTKAQRNLLLKKGCISHVKPASRRSIAGKKPRGVERAGFLVGESSAGNWAIISHLGRSKLKSDSGRSAPHVTLIFRFQRKNGPTHGRSRIRRAAAVRYSACSCSVTHAA